MVDGLKPGQRKILFCCFKRNIRRDVKVSLSRTTCIRRVHCMHNACHVPACLHGTGLETVSIQGKTKDTNEGGQHKHARINGW
jgi:hypothetical protein